MASSLSSSAFTCLSCNRSFGSDGALSAHRCASHGATAATNAAIATAATPVTVLMQEFLTKPKRRLLSAEWLDPPFMTFKGEWVPRLQYPGVKSFSVFQCSGEKSCKEFWLSAHGFKNEYTQQCLSCREKCQPVIMWLNYPKDDSSDDSEHPVGPHACTSCQACQKRKICCANKEECPYSGLGVYRSY
jgi:hypothetical protein